MKVAPVSNICYLVFPAHLCPVRPRVLDTCSLIYRAIHIRGVWDPPEPELDSVLFLGATTSLRFYYDLVLMPCYFLYLNCARSTLYCLGSGHDSAVSTSPATLSGSQSFTAVYPNLEPVSESAGFVAGST